MRKMAPCVRKMLSVGKAGARIELISEVLDSARRRPLKASLPHLVEHLAVELSLLPLALHLGHLDHIPQQVEGQVDGERRILAALQQRLLLLAVSFGRQQVDSDRVPPPEEPQQVVAGQIRGGAVRFRPEENIVHSLRLEEAAAAIQPAGEGARFAGGRVEV